MAEKTERKKLITSLERESKEKLDEKLEAKHHVPDKDTNSLKNDNVLLSLLSNYNLIPKGNEDPKEEETSKADQILDKYKTPELSADEKTLKKLNEIEKVLERRIAQETVWRKLALSFFTGITATLGATIGFTILLFALSRLYTGFQDVPLIGDWLEQDPLVQRITNRLSDEVDTE